MSENSYDVNANGKEGRLWFWFRLDYWSFTDACLLIADIDPHSLVVTENNKFVTAANLKGVVYDYLSDDHGFAIESEIILSEYQDKYNDLHNWLNPNSLSNYPPNYWIDLAISKKIHIPWLDFAIEMDFYAAPKTKTLLANNTKKNMSSNYTTDLMSILNQAADEFFNPRKVQDAKKEEVSEWIRNKGIELKIDISENISDAMFTIIKPHDHNPKIKRTEPQI
jgi:hypothetical protein